MTTEATEPDKPEPDINIVHYDMVLASVRPILLRWAREANGLTIQQLADKIGKSRSVVGHYESGEAFPPFDVREKIAEVLGITVLDIERERGVANGRWVQPKPILMNARNSAGLSLLKVATHLSVSHSTVFLWETGQARPRPPLVPKLAAILGLSVRDVVAACAPMPQTLEQRMQAAFNAMPEVHRERIVRMVENEVDLFRPKGPDS